MWYEHLGCDDDQQQGLTEYPWISGAESKWNSASSCGYCKFCLLSTFCTGNFMKLPIPPLFDNRAINGSHGGLYIWSTQTLYVLLRVYHRMIETPDTASYLSPTGLLVIVDCVL